MNSGLFEMQWCSALMIVKTLYIFRFMLPSLQEIITVIVICLPKKDVGVLKRVRVFQVELEFISGGFERRKKENLSTLRKTSRSKGESQKQIQPTFTSSNNWVQGHFSGRMPFFCP